MLSSHTGAARISGHYMAQPEGHAGNGLGTPCVLVHCTHEHPSPERHSREIFISSQFYAAGNIETTIITLAHPSPDAGEKQEEEGRIPSEQSCLNPAVHLREINFRAKPSKTQYKWDRGEPSGSDPTL